MGLKGGLIEEGAYFKFLLERRGLIERGLKRGGLKRGGLNRAFMVGLKSVQNTVKQSIACLEKTVLRKGGMISENISIINGK